VKANAREFKGLTFWDVFKNSYLIMVLSTLKNRKTKTSNDKPTEQDLTAKDDSMPSLWCIS
jgi:hypothetical protein